MTWFRNLTIGMKLSLGFGLVLSFMGVLGIFSLIQLAALGRAADDLGSNWFPSVQTISAIRVDAANIRRYELQHILSSNNAEYEALLNETQKKMGEDERSYEPTITSDKERELYQGFRSEWDKYLGVEGHVLEFSRRNKDEEAGALALNEGRPLFESADRFLADDVSLNQKGAEDSTRLGAAIYRSSRYWVVGILIGAIFTGLAVAFTIARFMSSSVATMLSMIQEVAANNLATADMEITSRDEIGQAGIALNRMKNNLHQVIQSISGTAIQVAGASEELSSTSQQITANAEETSAQANVVSAAAEQVSQNVHTVATGAEEMGASIKEIAKNANEAAKVATSAVKVAETTNATVAKLGESAPRSASHQGHHLHRPADQPAGPQRHHRGGARRRSRQGLRRRRQRSQGTRQADRQGDRGHQPQDRGHPGRHQGGGRGHRHHQRRSSTRSTTSQNTIATAVEEQNATTNEMARNVSEAAHGSGEITSNISGCGASRGEHLARRRRH